MKKMGKIELKVTLSSPSASFPIKSVAPMNSEVAEQKGKVISFVTSGITSCCLSSSKKTCAVKKLGHGFRDSAEKGESLFQRAKGGNEFHGHIWIIYDTRHKEPPYIEDHNLRQSRRKLKKELKKITEYILFNQID